MVSLDLHALAGTSTDHGNLLGLVSSVTMADGSQHQMADVWFGKAAAASPAVHLDELLAGPPSELLASAAAAVPVVHAAAVDHAAVSAEQQRLLVDEAHRNGPLI